MPAEIRRAVPKDLEDILPLMRDFHAHEEVEQTDEVRRRVLGDVLRTPALGALLVAEGPLGLQGYAAVLFGTSIEFGGRYAFLDELYVDPALRGQGIGRRLLAQAERFAVLSGAAVVFLEVADVNEKAQALYARDGYHLHARRLMSKRLPPAPAGTQR
ncbi:MAG TPA: GNAT family N-acetyltransferase [Candidatus Thermoplasmatota archaeon]|nr:GNAT family N-acetyltransferase [Candidatus Thermoplasmatota archaeon]